jgi:hypothetical protein
LIEEPECPHDLNTETFELLGPNISEFGEVKLYKSPSESYLKLETTEMKRLCEVVTLLDAENILGLFSKAFRYQKQASQALFRTWISERRRRSLLKGRPDFF